MTYHQITTIIAVPLFAIDLFIVGWFIKTYLGYKSAKNIVPPNKHILMTYEEILTIQVILFFFIAAMISIYVWLIPFIIPEVLI